MSVVLLKQELFTPQVHVCDAGVQHKGSEVPEGGAGCASLWVCVQPEEHGGRRGEHLIKSGAYTRSYSQLLAAEHSVTPVFWA